MSAESGGDTVDEDTKRLLEEFIKNGNVARVADILDKIGWDVLMNSVSFSCKIPTKFGDTDTATLLHIACRHRHPGLVKLLLENNADPDLQSLQQQASPLHVGARHGDAEICALLISSGCIVDAVDVDGKTPLHHASLIGADRVVKLLIEHGANVNHGDDLVWRPLHYASLLGKNGAVQLLADGGADIDCRTIHGRTPLHYASGYGLTSTADLLVRLGADTTIADRDQLTALYFAVSRGFLQTARTLVSSLGLRNPSLAANTLYGHVHPGSVPRVNQSAEFCVCTQGTGHG